MIASLAALAGIEVLAVAAALQVPAGHLNVIGVSEQGAADFLIPFAVATLLLVALLRWARNRIIFEALFGAALFFGVIALATAFFSYGATLLIAAGVLALRLGFPRVIIHNVAALVGLAGVAFTLGIAVRPSVFAILLAVLAVYDIVAVYGTRHMTRLFSGLLERGVVAALILPTRLRGWFAPVALLRPGEDAHLLGTGDLALPSVLVVSALRDGLLAAAGAGLGSLLGLLATEFLFLRQRRHRPMPALPPIATGAIIGYFFARLVV